MDKIYRARKAAFDWLMEQGLQPSIENVVIALDELGYLKDVKQSVVTRDAALTKRNQELRHLRRLVGKLKGDKKNNTP